MINDLHWKLAGKRKQLNLACELKALNNFKTELKRHK